MKTAIYSVLVAASLALTANAATAAGTQVHKPVTAHVSHRTNDYGPLTLPPKAYTAFNYSMGQLGQFMQALANGTPMPQAEAQLARNVARWRAAHHIGGTYYFGDD